MQYRNTLTGRVLERPAPDRWLEASAGWELIDEPAPVQPEADTAPEAADTPDTGDNERTDD